MIYDIERYKRICSQIDLYKARSQDTFNRFITLSLGSVGGFVWLGTQPHIERVEYLLPVARWVLPALAGITVVELALDLIGWFGFRKAESAILDDPRIRPRFPYSGRSEILRSVIAIAVGVAGYCLLR
ncbi:MAG: hypothetical protein WDN44_01930 [Sphingomonas sp.]